MFGAVAFLRALVALCLLLFAVPAVAGEARTLAPPPIRLAACVAPAASLSVVEATAIRADARFDCTSRQTDLAGSEFWARAELSQPLAANGWRLRWSSTWQQRADVTFIFADGTRRTVRLDQHRASPFIQTGALFQLPVPVADSPLVAVATRISGAANLRGIWLNPTLMTSDAAAEHNNALAWLYGGFLGLCIALFIYNLMIWTALRQDYLLAYCGMLTAILVYAVSSSGLLADIVPTMANNDRLRINYLSLSIVACFALAFARTFLEPQIFTRRMRAGAWLVAGQMLLAGLCFALLAPWQIQRLDSLYFASFAVGFGYLGYAFSRGLRLGGVYTRLYVLSWSAPLLLSMVRMAHGFGLVPQSFLLDNSTLIAMTVEAVLSSMIIANRIRNVQLDRDAAQARETAAQQLADTDPLTGLLNRRALLRIACPAEPGKDWRLVLIDIDHFKRVNDLAGHDTGDQVLIVVARAIQASLRQGAVAARIGGEEFAILFPIIDDERRSYASLLGRIQSMAMPGNLHITVSMGVADGALGPDETQWRQLYRDADAALFAAKRSGRNCMIHAADLRPAVGVERSVA